MSKDKKVIDAFDMALETAKIYGRSFLSVDEEGNISVINPQEVFIHLIKLPKKNYGKDVEVLTPNFKEKK